MRVLPAEPYELAWVVKRASVGLTPFATAIKAVDNAGVIRGMVCYDNRTHNSIEAHMAVDTPIAWRVLLRAVFSYPFEQLHLGVLLGVIPASNARSLRMAKRLGLVEVHRVRDGWAAGEDLIIHELRRENCRWLSNHRKAA